MSAVVVLDPSPSLIPNTQPALSPPAQQERQAVQQTITALIEENQALAKELKQVRAKLLSVQIKNGDLEPPKTIRNKGDAQIWFVWAKANHHPAHCQCHGCTAARSQLNNR